MKNRPQADVMHGVVRGFSRNKQRIAVQTDLGYTVFDLVHGEVNLHDEISGDLNMHGRVDLSNLTTRRTLSAYIEAIQATTSAAQTLLGHK